MIELGFVVVGITVVEVLLVVVVLGVVLLVVVVVVLVVVDGGEVVVLFVVLGSGVVVVVVLVLVLVVVEGLSVVVVVVDVVVSSAGTGSACPTVVSSSALSTVIMSGVEEEGDAFCTTLRTTGLATSDSVCFISWRGSASPAVGLPEPTYLVRLTGGAGGAAAGGAAGPTKPLSLMWYLYLLRLRSTGVKGLRVEAVGLLVLTGAEVVLVSVVGVLLWATETSRTRGCSSSPSAGLIVKPPGRRGGNLAPKKTYGFSSSSSSSASSSMELVLLGIPLPITGGLVPSAMWFTVAFCSLATTKSPWEDSSLKRISLVSRSPEETAALAEPGLFSTTELLPLEAMAMRVKLAHCRMQLAVVRRVKFLVQFRMHTDLGSLGALEVLSTAADGEMALLPVVPILVRKPPRCRAVRRAASTFISFLSRS